MHTTMASTLSEHPTVKAFHARTASPAVAQPLDAVWLRALCLEAGVVYHTYSTYARGVDGLWGMYQWLDRAPRGRNETGVWWRRHDEYGQR